VVLYQRKVLNCGFGLVVICDILEIEDKCDCCFAVIEIVNPWPILEH